MRYTATKTDTNLDAGADSPKTNVGWRIPREIKSRFALFCKNVGATLELSVCGAIVSWEEIMPAELRERYRQHVSGTNLISPEYRDLPAWLVLAVPLLGLIVLLGCADASLWRSVFRVNAMIRYQKQIAERLEEIAARPPVAPARRQAPPCDPV